VEAPIPTRPPPLVACSWQHAESRAGADRPRTERTQRRGTPAQVGGTSEGGPGGARVRPPPAYALITWLARPGRIRLTARARQGRGRERELRWEFERGDWGVERATRTGTRGVASNRPPPQIWRRAGSGAERGQVGAGRRGGGS